jgi:hypothetical protein
LYAEGDFIVGPSGGSFSAFKLGFGTGVFGGNAAVGLGFGLGAFTGLSIPLPPWGMDTKVANEPSQ